MPINNRHNLDVFGTLDFSDPVNAACARSNQATNSCDAMLRFVRVRLSWQSIISMNAEIGRRENTAGA